MTTHTAVSIALEVMQRLAGQRGDDPSHPVNAMQVQKLVYYCHAYNLALYDEPLIREKVQAWVHGPVVRELWELHRGQIAVTQDELRARAERDGYSFSSLSSNQKLVVDAVCEALGGLTGWQLRNRTHEEDPWKDHFDREDTFHDRAIPEEDMRQYYKDR